MKVNATARGRRICDTVGKMLSEYDQPVIVLRFNDNGVEASVHVEGIDDIITLKYEDDNITGAIRGLDSDVRARVISMAKGANIDLALPDEDT